MLCAKQINTKKNGRVNCGRCHPCRIRRKQEWVLRMALETTLHPSDTSWFITLTYADGNLPEGGNLDKKGAQAFLKRLQTYAVRAGHPSPRYYLVGEYGTRTLRPHYHACLFGLADPSLVSKAWQLGHVHIRRLDTAAMKYTVGYIMKGRTKDGHSELGDLVPEFALMSTRPGLGSLGAARLAAGLPHVVHNELLNGGNPALVQPSLIMGGIRYSLGRYLRSKFREAAGLPAVLSDTERRSVWGYQYVRILQEGGLDAYLRKQDNNRKVAAATALARYRTQLAGEKL